MTDTPPEQDMWRSINPQAWIYASIQKCLFARQHKPEEFKHHVAGVWVGLFPTLKEKLSKRIGDREANEKVFEQLFQEVLKNDVMIDAAVVVKAQDDNEISACEIILNEIMKVLDEAGLLTDKDARTMGTL